MPKNIVTKIYIFSTINNLSLSEDFGLFKLTLLQQRLLHTEKEGKRMENLWSLMQTEQPSPECRDRLTLSLTQQNRLCHLPPSQNVRFPTRGQSRGLTAY
jgi:hypothetical protein